MPTPRVIDLSHHNTIPESLEPAKAAGIIACIHKLSEGKSYVDDKVQARYYLAKDAGMAWGLYHFLRPGDMRQQAKFFIDTAIDLGVIDDFETMLAADHEDPGVSYDDLIEFLEAVEEQSGRSPVIYSGHVIKDQCGTSKPYPNKYRLWLAQYSSSPGLPEGCIGYWLWQYSDKGEVAGIDPPTDVNHFEGDAIAFLDGWAGLAEIEPGPEPEPAPEYATITLSSDVPVALRLVAGENVTIVEE